MLAFTKTVNQETKRLIFTGQAHENASAKVVEIQKKLPYDITVSEEESAQYDLIATNHTALDAKAEYGPMIAVRDKESGLVKVNYSPEYLNNQAEQLVDKMITALDEKNIKNPSIITPLRGGFIFMAPLLQSKYHNCIDPVVSQSLVGTKFGGASYQQEIKVDDGIDCVVLLDDTFDSGYTIAKNIRSIRKVYEGPIMVCCITAKYGRKGTNSVTSNYGDIQLPVVDYTQDCCSAESAIERLKMNLSHMTFASAATSKPTPEQIVNAAKQASYNSEEVQQLVKNVDFLALTNVDFTLSNLSVQERQTTWLSFDVTDTKPLGRKISYENYRQTIETKKDNDKILYPLLVIRHEENSKLVQLTTLSDEGIAFSNYGEQTFPDFDSNKIQAPFCQITISDHKSAKFSGKEFTTMIKQYDSKEQNLVILNRRSVSSIPNFSPSEIDQDSSLIDTLLVSTGFKTWWIDDNQPSLSL